MKFLDAPRLVSELLGNSEHIQSTRDSKNYILSKIDFFKPIQGTMASTTASAENEIDGSAIKSRAYQIEMLEESLKGNVIVAVGFSHPVTVTVDTPANNTQFRWILAAVKHTCKF